MICIYILFFPGVVIHEFSHWLVAELLFVHVHDVDFVPQVKNGRIRLGSVQIRETDALRRFIIGVAPVVIGITLLFIILAYFVENFEINFSYLNILKTAGIIWSLFFITNTMFSSRKDMEGFFEFIAVVGFFLLVTILGLTVAKIDFISPVLSFLTNPTMQMEVRKISVLFLIPLFINFFCLLSSKILTRG